MDLQIKQALFRNFKCSEEAIVSNKLVYDAVFLQQHTRLDAAKIKIF
jgi:hypothetical protein